MAKKVKGIGLLSGGLDSILAVKVLQEQKLELSGITFVTPFFGAEPGIRAGRIAGIPVQALDITEAHLEMLRHPRYGYGSQMNPCIDCHALMLRLAGNIMEKEKADFLFTGEVLGQRPMSQRRDSLKSVENLSGYAGRILRPLSARLLDPTEVELKGLVDRERLLDIHGRSRKRQVALAQHYGIKEYPQPGGGCMLTKEGFALKLRELFKLYPDASGREVEMLKWGRHFYLPGNTLFMVGRNLRDNEQLESLSSPADVVMRVPDYPSPLGILVRPASVSEDDLSLAAQILIAYSDAPGKDAVLVEWAHDGIRHTLTSSGMTREQTQNLMIA